MKIIIEITSKDEALAAQQMLSAYLGQGSISVGIEHTEIEKPKVKVARAKDAVKKDTKPIKEEPVVEKEEPKGNIDLAELTKIAKAAVAKTDRVTVKDAISAYGAKLSEVEEGDYQTLADELKAL